MSAEPEPHGLSHHPAPARDEMSTLHAHALLFTGPFAWFLQFLVGVPLANWPCYPADTRLMLPAEGYGWTRGAALLLLGLCVVAAAIAALASWRLLQRVSDAREGGHAEPAEVGHGRTRFIALWGVCLGVGFAIATLLTFVGFALVPRCAG
jgi:hypothetical protein